MAPCWLLRMTGLATLAASLLLEIGGSRAAEDAPAQDASATANRVELRWKFADQEDLRYSVRINQRASLAGASQQPGSEQLLNVHWHVNRVLEDGSAAISCRFSSIRATLESPGPGGTWVKGVYDSQEKKRLEGPLAGMNTLFDTMLASEFTFVISPLGVVTEFKIPDSALKAIAVLAAGGGFGLNASREALTALATTPVVPFPRDAVTTTDRWERTTMSTLPGGIEMKEISQISLKSLLKVRGRRTARLDIVPKLERLDPDKKPVAPVRLVDQSGQATADFDYEEGHTTRLSGTQRLEIEFTPFAGKSVPQTVIHEVTVRKLGNPAPAGTNRTAPTEEAAPPDGDKPDEPASDSAEAPLKMPDP